MSLAKLDYFHYIISGTTYIFSGGYSLIASLGNLLKRPNDDELVLNGLNNLYLVRRSYTARTKNARICTNLFK